MSEKKMNLDACPDCGCQKLNIEEKWDEEHGAYVVGVVVYCSRCGKVKHDDWYNDTYVENWIDLYEQMYKEKSNEDNSN